MARPTLLDNLSDHKRILGANMCHRSEDWAYIAKFTGLNDGAALHSTMQTLADELVQPMSNAMYMTSIELAQTEYLADVALKAAEDGSPRHMSEYNKISAHRLKIIKQLDELEELEKEKGLSWEPLFDTNSIEFKIFQAAMELYLTRETSVDDEFDQLTQQEQDRFFKLMAESG